MNLPTISAVDAETELTVDVGAKSGRMDTFCTDASVTGTRIDGVFDDGCRSGLSEHRIR